MSLLVNHPGNGISHGDAILSVEHAAKSFSVRRRSFRRVAVTAVDDVSLYVNRGEMVGLVGESGSGKSTLGRALLNLLALDSGRIVFDGQEIQGLPESEFRPLRSRIQMVFQNPATSFNPTMTIGQALVDAMRLLHGASSEDKKHRAMLLLDQMQLDERFASLYPYEMSGGQLQRVALARALAPDPEFIFLDETTAALDMSIRGQIINLLLQLQRQRDLGFIFVSHDLRVIRYVSDRVYVMYLGQVVEIGPKQQIFSNPRHPYTRALLAATLVGRDDKAARQRRAALSGEAILKSEDFRGCKLYGRCPYARPRCADEPQPLLQVQPDHWVRCWRADEIGTNSGSMPAPD